MFVVRPVELADIPALESLANMGRLGRAYPATHA